MKSCNPEDKWVEGEWVAYSHETHKVVSGFATELSCWNYIHSHFLPDANGVTENVTAEWMESVP